MYAVCAQRCLIISLFYRRQKRLTYPHWPYLMLWLTLSDSNYPCLEQMSMVRNMFKSWFDYIFIFFSLFIRTGTSYIILFPIILRSFLVSFVSISRLVNSYIARTIFFPSLLRNSSGALWYLDISFHHMPPVFSDSAFNPCPAEPGCTLPLQTV